MTRYALRLRQFADLVRIFFADFRDIWHYTLIFSLMLPLGLIYFLKFTNAGGGNPELLVYFISGNVITSLAFGVGQLLINRLGWARQNRHFDYWASLPVSKLAVVLSMVSVYVLFALPGILGVLVLGTLMLHTSLTLSPLLIPTVLLTVLSVSALAAFLGTYAKDGNTANLLANVLGLVVVFLSPVMVPAEQMGGWTKYTSALLPTSYAARAMREVLLGRSAAAWADLGILTVLTILFLALVQWKLDWRGEQ